MLKPRKSKTKKVTTNKSNFLNFELQRIYPKTENQERTFELYKEGKNLVLYGSAGTGKTMIPLYLGLKDIVDNNAYSKLIIVRSAVETRQIGFLPGDEKLKLAVYEAPYRNIINNLFGRDDAYELIKQKNVISFESTSFLRGLTYDDTLIIVDEFQNLTLHEISSIVTRLGLNSRIVFCGDINQSDLNPKKETTGIQDFLKIACIMEEFGLIQFTLDDIVRSDIVRSYLVAKENLGL